MINLQTDVVAFLIPDIDSQITLKAFFLLREVLREWWMHHGHQRGSVWASRAPATGCQHPAPKIHQISLNWRSHLHNTTKSLIWVTWLAQRSPNGTKGLQQVTQVSPTAQKFSQRSSPIHPKAIHLAKTISQVNDKCAQSMKVFEINCSLIDNDPRPPI